MFKTSGGKYVAPALIENQFKQSRFIEQIMVIGEGKKMPAALIQPNFEFINDWIERKNKNVEKSMEAICSSEIIQQRIQKEIDEANEKFGKWEQIKRFELTPEVWSIDAGHLTPTMKMKRKVIKEKYLDLIDKIYRP
jgi:long-chain acyl-CoA synthetase